MGLKAFVVLSIFLLACPGSARSQASLPEAAGANGDIVHVVAGSNQDKVWQPNSEQRVAVVREVSSYFAAKDAGRFADAYEQFTPEQKTVVPFAAWESKGRAAREEWGEAKGRTIEKVTWYKDPNGSPPGIYVAVDFSGRFAELALHCGYVALQLQQDQSFGIVREEENTINKREMEKLSPAELQQVRSHFRC